MDLDLTNVNSKQDRSQLINRLVEERPVDDLRDLLDSLEVEESCLESSLEALQSSLARSFPSVIHKTGQLLALQEQFDTRRLDQLEARLDSLEQLQTLEQHLARMRKFDSYARLTAQFAEFKEAVHGDAIKSWTVDELHAFVARHRLFLGKLRRADSHQVDLRVFQDKIRECYTLLLEAHAGGQSRQQPLAEILACWPLEQENSVLKTKVLSLCLRDFPDKQLRLEDYAHFVARACRALAFLKSLEPALCCDLLTVNSLLVSLKAYHFEPAQFESLAPLASSRKLFQGNRQSAHADTRTLRHNSQTCSTCSSRWRKRTTSCRCW